jgi:Protein of unknown function (DUF3467)
MTQRPQNINLTPPVDAGGHYADFVLVWQSGETFVIDFAAITTPPLPSDDPDGASVQAQVVSRVRIPPSQVFEIMKALETELSKWERRTGNEPRELRGGGQPEA